MMGFREEAVIFDCEGERLVGVISLPAEFNENYKVTQTTGIVIVVGGPQYRAGSHRQFVLLSRELATAGFATLRFDYRGMGDSQGQKRDFEAVTEDIASAIDKLQQCVPAVKQVALWGLCDGASAALLYCDETHDRRVTTLCLINPWVRSAESLARTQVKHYYLQRLMQKEFWAKLLRGEVAYRAMSELATNIQVAFGGQSAPKPSTATSQKHDLSAVPFQQRMASAWKLFDGRLLLLLSGDDFTAKEFTEHINNNAAWEGAMKHSHLIRHELPGVDHTFSSARFRALAERLTLQDGLNATEIKPSSRPFS
jgi:exosortase A-associated hydrolase 1